jgi:hypothetical protein
MPGEYQSGRTRGSGTIAELREAVIKKHRGDKYEPPYLGAILFITTLWQSEK